MSKKTNEQTTMKNIYIIIACVLVAAALAFIFIFNALQDDEVDGRVFAHGNHTVTLNGDGTFAARLFHGFRVDGTFTESFGGGMTTVYFTHDDETVRGRITSNILTIPIEWDDGHGHGRNFTLRE